MSTGTEGPQKRPRGGAGAGCKKPSAKIKRRRARDKTRERRRRQGKAKPAPQKREVRQMPAYNYVANSPPPKPEVELVANSKRYKVRRRTVHL